MELEGIPGRVGFVRGKAVSNARRAVCISGSGWPQRYAPGEWGVRMGSRYYPDYATPDPVRWDGQHGGTYLSADEAEELANHLLRCASWARAQNTLEPS